MIKPRKKNKPGQGRKREGRTRSVVAMLPEEWARLDALPGKIARGKKIAKLLPCQTQINHVCEHWVEERLGYPNEAS